MTQAMRDAHPNAHRNAWIGTEVGLGLFAINYGIGYLWQGNVYATSPALHVLRSIYGGMHTHGGILLALGLALIYQAVNVDASSRYWPTRLFCSYAILTALSIFGSWWITDQIAFSAPWAWVAFGIISGVLIVYPPPPRWLPDASP